MVYIYQLYVNVLLLLIINYFEKKIKSNRDSVDAKLEFYNACQRPNVNQSRGQTAPPPTNYVTKGKQKRWRSHASLPETLGVDCMLSGYVSSVSLNGC